MRDIPIGIGLDSPADRLRRLELLSLRAAREGDLFLVAKCIELAAREQRAEPRGAEDRTGCPACAMTPDEAREEIAVFLDKHHAQLGRGEGEGRMQYQVDAGAGGRAGPRMMSE